MEAINAPGTEISAPTLRRVLLVTTRSSTLVAVQRACRRDRGLGLRFYTHPVAAASVASDWIPDAVLLDLSCAGRVADLLVARIREQAPRATIAVLGDVQSARLASAVERIGADGGISLATGADAVEQLRVLRAQPVRASVEAA